ncbi:hypothetical protein D1871_11460 [Nakamurella silvestris]|nr:hypothetical protein D1871_11460 [Nakamurella silvestris]
MRTSTVARPEAGARTTRTFPRRRVYLAAALVLAVTAPITPIATAFGAPPPTGYAASAPAAPLVTAAATPPGSIVFVKNHNIWIAKGDGSGQRQITKDGRAGDDYWSPTMSDAGIIAAANGPFIVRMKQDGTLLNRMDPPRLKNSLGHYIDGPPMNVAISPDGKLIAYTFADANGRTVTAYTAANTLTSATKYGTTFLQNPYWVSNTRTLQTGGYGHQLNFHDVGAKTDRHWFDDYDIYDPSTDLGDAAVSRNGTLLAAVRGYGNTSQFIWYEVRGDVRKGIPGLPKPLCKSDMNSGYSGPVLAPDGSAIATSEPDGIWIKTRPRECSYPGALKIRGGSEPFWSPAAVQPLPKKFANSKLPAVTGTAKAGKKVAASPGRWSPTPSKFSYQWKRSGKAISGATSRIYTVKSADRGKTLSVTVTATRAGYITKAATSKSVKVAK